MFVCLLVLVGCSGSGGGGSGAARPGRVNGAVSRFDDLPRYPRSRALGARVRSDKGVLVQTFAVPETTPEVVAGYFDDRLPQHGWTAVVPARPDAAGSARGVWRDGNLHLVVATSQAPTLQDPGAAQRVSSQYSFVLYPAGVPVGVGTTSG